jgi:6-pyruvoyltetrahydropterin/6-carboxytetrahydropterin synthase
MFLLTREVRFALSESGDTQFRDRPTNSFGGYPSLRGVQPFLTIQITLAGQLQPSSSYLRNIKEIDDVIRTRAIGQINGWIEQPHAIPVKLFDLLRDAWPGTQLERVNLLLSPYLSLSCSYSEHPMIRLSQTFEFCASHRLHNEALSEEENRKTFGKCNNPFGHGHNYRLKVTLKGTPGSNGVLIDLPAMERIVDQAIIEKFDHKNLNVELPEFKNLLPSVENIAMVIYRTLQPKFAETPAKLANVKVWETSKTACEYEE